VFGIVATMEDMPDEQAVASGALVAFAGDTLLTVSSPFWVGGQKKVAPRHAPAAGADGASVLAAAGYAEAEIAALRAAGVTA